MSEKTEREMTEKFVRLYHYDEQKQRLNLEDLIVEEYEEFITEKKPHNLSSFDWLVRYEFSNGYGASVVSGKCAIGKFAEIAILDTIRDSITFKTPITDDVIGTDTKEQLKEALKEVFNLKKFLPKHKSLKKWIMSGYVISIGIVFVGVLWGLHIFGVI